MRREKLIRGLAAATFVFALIAVPQAAAAKWRWHGPTTRASLSQYKAFQQLYYGRQENVAAQLYRAVYDSAIAKLRQAAAADQNFYGGDRMNFAPDTARSQMPRHALYVGGAVAGGILATVFAREAVADVTAQINPVFDLVASLTSFGGGIGGLRAAVLTGRVQREQRNYARREGLRALRTAGIALPGRLNEWLTQVEAK